MATPFSQEKIEQRIALLLRKAESTTPEEAEALTEHAERLMLRYGIERARAEAAAAGRDLKPEEIVTLEVGLPSGHFATAYAILIGDVGRAYGTVRTYLSILRDGATGKPIKVTKIVGYQSDCEAVRTLTVSLMLQARSAMEKWWAEERYRHPGIAPAAAGKIRRDYIVGFGYSAAVKLKGLRTVVHAEAETEEPGTAVAILDRKAAVDAAYDALNLGKGRTYTIGADGYGAGSREGRNANVGGTAVGGGRKAIGH